MYYEQLSADQKRIEQQIKSVKEQLNCLPQGQLICTHSGKYTKWYQSCPRSMKYIPKKNRVLAEQLALKKYLLLKLDELNTEKSSRYIAYQIILI